MTVTWSTIYQGDDGLSSQSFGCSSFFSVQCQMDKYNSRVLFYQKWAGPIRELNPGPLIPETRIILLDQWASIHSTKQEHIFNTIINNYVLYNFSSHWLNNTKIICVRNLIQSQGKIRESYELSVNIKPFSSGNLWVYFKRRYIC